MDLPRILVIDDEELLGQTIQFGLEDRYSVELVTSGREGLQSLLTGANFDLILCDLSLPDLSGAQIYQRICLEKPELQPRFVVMTGGAMTSESRQFLSNYQGRLLNKPFTLSQVESLVADLS